MARTCAHWLSQNSWNSEHGGKELRDRPVGAEEAEEPVKFQAQQDTGGHVQRVVVQLSTERCNEGSYSANAAMTCRLQSRNVCGRGSAVSGPRSGGI